MGFESYKGSIKLGAGLTPASEGFPLMQSCDIQIDENGKTLAEYIENGIDSIEGLQDALDGLQKRNDESLKTEDKTIVGAINEVNANTIDKIALIDAWAGEKTELVIEGIDGINWTEQFTLFDKNQNPLSSGEMALRVPLVAGENVTFEVDEESQVVKINATGGGSTDNSVSLIGTWTVIDEPEIPQEDLPLSFTSNGTEYMAIGYTSMGSSTWGINALSYQRRDEGYYEAAYTNNPSGNYGITHGWSNEAYKTITVAEEPTDANAIAWLGANTDAPKITPTVSLPSCDSSNEGQFLRVIGGIPTWSSVPNAEDNVF